MAEGAPYIATSSTQPADAWADEAAARGHRGTQRIASAAQTAAPPDVAQALNLPAGSPIITRRRVVLLNERPVELADSHYPADIATGTALAEPAKIPGGAAALLTSMGHVAAEILEDVGARMPTADERAALQLDSDEPVLILARTSLTASGRPFEYAVMTMVARDRRLRYRFRAA